MSHSFTKLYYHCIFSTKGKRRLLRGPATDEIDLYIAGIAKNIGVHLWQSGGIDNHRHILLELRPNQNLSEVMRDIKSNSSRWLREKFPDQKTFEWQGGYSGFTVSKSLRDRVKRYIQNQAEHHHTRTFEEELEFLLNFHEISYDPKWLQED